MAAPTPDNKIMATIILHVMVADDVYTNRLEKLYKLAKSHGFEMSSYYKDKPENQQRAGKQIAIAQMIEAIGAGKLKVT